MSNKRRIPSSIPIIKKHLERVAKVSWDKVLSDPRSSKHKKDWDFGYAMNMLFYGILGGSKNFRDIEVLSEKYDERIPDTTLHDISVQVDAEPVRGLIVKSVKQALRDHELPKEEFPVRITAIDGKSVSVSSIGAGVFSQLNEGAVGKVRYVNRVLRAFHVSNATKLCIGQREICGKKAESSEFKPFVDTLVADYGNTDLLEVISIDAGMISRSNADYVIEQELNYIMALKNPQTVLVENAKQLLGSRQKSQKTTEESSHGRTVLRQLYRCIVPDEDKNGWEHLREFWRIVQTTTTHNTGEVVSEERYFVSSIDPQKLNNTHVLNAIRTHWAIENNGNWVTDVAWEEDEAPFASKALVLVTLLRMFAYNITSRLLTRRLRKVDARRLSWARLMDLVEHALFQLRSSKSFQEFIRPAFV